VHVGLVDDALADRRRRGRAAAQALAPVDPAGLGVEREEEPLLLRQVDAPVADRRRELERVVRPDLPEPAVGRAVVVGRDVVARDVVAVGRPGPRVELLGRRLRLRLLVGLELLAGRAALLDRVGLVLVDVDPHRNDHDSD
jgi:hypothetical protein